MISTGILYAKVAGSWVAVANSVGGLTKAQADGYYVDVTGDTMTGLLTMAGMVSNENVRLVENASGLNHLSFYNAAQTTRKGYIGYGTAVGYYIKNEVATGSMFLDTPYAISFTTAGVETARFDNVGNFLVGKTVAGMNTAGIQLQAGSNLGLGGYTVDTDIQNLSLNKIGAGIASGGVFVGFRHTNTLIGSISRNAATSAVLYNTTSDYRLKNDLGPIPEAANRVKRLRPIQVTWKDDPTERVVDAFMAHEVAEVVPDAVTGEKDAEEMQQLDATRLIPLLTAALQEAHDRIDRLEARLAALEAA